MLFLWSLIVVFLVCDCFFPRSVIFSGFVIVVFLVYDCCFSAGCSSLRGKFPANQPSNCWETNFANQTMCNKRALLVNQDKCLGAKIYSVSGVPKNVPLNHNMFFEDIQKDCFAVNANSKQDRPWSSIKTFKNTHI